MEAGQVAVSEYLDIDKELCLASGRHLFWQGGVIYIASYPPQACHLRCIFDYINISKKGVAT